MTAKRKPNQHRYFVLKDTLISLGQILWEGEVNVYVYDNGKRLQVSAGGYVKYECPTCDTPAKLLEEMQKAVDEVVKALRARRDEIDEALSPYDNGA